ncbi:hypothetical protein B6I74_10415 [Klebsiella variicola]|nr:hypothetical protein BVZ23_03180 [Klebsiella variicola]OWW16158.1 hypothetical protein BUE65_09395 [Klebsiella variicola]PLE60389.1 hypothetical protein B6I74_10415 [Klebsiella variicola]
MVLHKIMAAKPIDVALFFCIFNLIVTQTQPEFITSFAGRWSIFPAGVNSLVLVKLVAADY